MQLRYNEATEYGLTTTLDGGHTRVYANAPFAEGAVIGSATAIFLSSKQEVITFLRSEARPNHRRFADRLFKLNDVLYEGVPKTFFGILLGVAGEVMAPGQGQRANVELALAPVEGLNPNLVKLVAKTRNKQGVAKGAELLCDYGDAFDVTLPVLASGTPFQMVGPMDKFMNHVSPERRASTLAPTQGQSTMHRVSSRTRRTTMAILRSRMRSASG